MSSCANNFNSRQKLIQFNSPVQVHSESPGLAHYEKKFQPKIRLIRATQLNFIPRCGDKNFLITKAALILKCNFKNNVFIISGVSGDARRRCGSDDGHLLRLVSGATSGSSGLRAVQQPPRAQDRPGTQQLGGQSHERHREHLEREYIIDPLEKNKLENYFNPVVVTLETSRDFRVKYCRQWQCKLLRRSKSPVRAE